MCFFSQLGNLIAITVADQLISIYTLLETYNSGAVNVFNRWLKVMKLRKILRILREVWLFLIHNFEMIFILINISCQGCWNEAARTLYIFQL